jgi:hypothetical protein
MRLWKQALAGVLALLMAMPASLLAQVPIPPPPPSAPPALFVPEQLEQIAAPIALYPDPLLAQVLMAATYPLEVVQAARFVQAYPNLQGGPLNDALRAQSWDDSVKSLVLFPQVLAMMNDKLDWTQRLGDAFLGQQQELMDAVQRLRARAQAQGTLATTAQQTVVVEQAPQPIIQIVPVNPQIIYVPVYNPIVVYGPWPYPAYPPYYYYPVGWPVGGAFFSFGPGIFVGIGLWGIFDWHRHHVVIDAPRYRRFTEVVNVEARRDELERVRAVRVEGNRFSWEHDVVHRRGVGYRDASIQQRVGGPRPADTAAREPFRGRIEPGRVEPGRVDQGRAPQTGVEPRRADQGRASQTGVEPRRADPERVQPERSESRRVEPGRVQPGSADQDRRQPDWAGRVPQGRVQPPAEQPRPSVQVPARPEPGRAQPGSAPRVETAPPSPGQWPGQRREPGMFQGIGNGGDARAHGERGRESRQTIAQPAPAPRTAPPPVSAPARPPAAVAPPSPPPAPSAPAPSAPPAQRPHGGGAQGREKRS